MESSLGADARYFADVEEILTKMGQVASDPSRAFDAATGQASAELADLQARLQATVQARVEATERRLEPRSLPPMNTKEAIMGYLQGFLTEHQPSPREIHDLLQRMLGPVAAPLPLPPPLGEREIWQDWDEIN